jgi:AraC-like DNA-binding protein
MSITCRTLQVDSSGNVEPPFDRLHPRASLAPRAVANDREAWSEWWTVARLAQAVGMGRSTFAVRFTQIVGRSPMDALAADARSGNIAARNQAQSRPNREAGGIPIGSRLPPKIRQALWHGPKPPA